LPRKRSRRKQIRNEKSKPLRLQSKISTKAMRTESKKKKSEMRKRRKRRKKNLEKSQEDEKEDEVRRGKEGHRPS